MLFNDPGSVLVYLFIGDKFPKESNFYNALCCDGDLVFIKSIYWADLSD